MTIDPSTGEWVNVAGGLAVSAMGVALLAIRKGRMERAAFGIFAVAFGLGFLGTNLLGETDGANRWDGAWFMVATVALVVAALRYPAPIPRSARRLLFLPALLIAATVAVGVITLNGHTHAIVTLRAPSQLMLAGVQWAAAVFWALRAAEPETSRDDARQYAILATAVVLYPTQLTGSILVPGLRFWGLSSLIFMSILAACWLRAGARGVEPRLSRAAAWWPLAAALATTLIMAVTGKFDPAGQGGTLRLLTVALLAYAVLRHQLLGIDVKVRFAISKSTIAAVFIAVFFIASEAAQQFFGDKFSNQQYGSYMGIAAAGTLVFALAPIQRLADRIAVKAVPVDPVSVPAGAWSAASASASNDDLYRRALRIALADRRLTADEDLTLAELSERLGLGARRALELRHEVEAERPGRRRRR